MNSGGTYVYNYNLSDHLGNTRYSFDIYGGAVRELQRDDYYAFGKRLPLTGGDNKYLYNGKELQEELGNTITGRGSMIRRLGGGIAWIQVLRKVDRKA